MDKPWIKAALISAFVITLGFVYVGAFRALQDAPGTPISVGSPLPPTLVQKPSLPANAKPEDVDLYLKTQLRALALDKQAVDNYTQQVNSYAAEVNAGLIAAKANSHDASSRLTAFEKVIKDTLGPLILAPLLAALLVYSGIKVSGDVAITRAAGERSEVNAP